ncbi:MAG: TIGR01459 family HAD-type hydrolase [Phenylobacterium sp.]|jgi:HAD superfamily hydrolase (TIGR01459 family)
MTAPRRIAGLSEIAARYDVILSDVWGVIHNGRESFPEATGALARFQTERGPVVLISNAPRPHPPIVEQLAGLGVPRAAWSRLVTSGDATRALLAPRAPGPVWALGPERDAILYEGLGLALAEPADAAFICVTGPYDDDTETAEDYRERLTAARDRGLVLICANPDLVVQKGDRLIPCAGALAQLYAGLGGQVEMAGKPHAPIYDLSLAAAAEVRGAAVDRARVLCVGDGLATDVTGANAQGLDVLLITTGIHGAEFEGASAEAIGDRLAERGLSANWTMPDLVW